MTLKKIFVTAISSLLLLTMVNLSNADLISVIGASNSTTTGTADMGGSVLTTTLVADNSTSGQVWAVTVSGLTLDTNGSSNDSVLLNFSVSTDGQNIQTSGSTANGWLSSGGTTLNANSEFVQIDFSSMAVTLSGGGASTSSFDGFTGVSVGSWASGHVAVINGISQAYVDGTTNKHFDLTGGGNDANLKAWFDVTANTGASQDAAGSWRPEGWDFQFTATANAVPEPSSLFLFASFGLFGLRRRK